MLHFDKRLKDNTSWKEKCDNYYGQLEAVKFEMRVACLHAVDIKSTQHICSSSCFGLPLAVQKLHLERLKEGLQEMLRLKGMEDEDKSCASRRAT